MRRVLIVRMSALGDIVHALPVLAAIRRAWPDATVDWSRIESPSGMVLVQTRIASEFGVPGSEGKGGAKHCTPRRAAAARNGGGRE